MKSASLTAVLALTVCFAGCGQKGPLVLPDAQHPHKKLTAPKSAAAPGREPAAPVGTTPTAPAAPATPEPALPAAVPAPQQ